MAETPPPFRHPLRQATNEIRLPQDRPIRNDPPCSGHPDRRERCVRDGLILMSCGCIISGCSRSHIGRRILEGLAAHDLFFCDVHETWGTIVDQVTSACVAIPVRPKDRNETWK